jgi:predicted alpha-1,2-mannosidase
MVKNTEGHGPVNSVGRYGAQYYNELGYVPYDVGINENAARTLEYAYADYCLWKLSEAIGKPKEEQEFHRQRAYNYRNLFRKDYNLMSGRNKDGSFPDNFSPYKWGDAFTEGNAWHYTWSVFQNIADLSDLMGGDAAFAKMLDSVFVVPPIFDNSYYGFTIHEIREMQIAGMGNYAHGNQPIQHMIYLYNYAGQPWKAQYRTREVLTKLYNYTADGYCGDEDNGQTSAWYVFSALGFYPVCPGTDQYVLGSPLFDEVKMIMPGGETLHITAENNGKGKPYIQSASFNGKAWDKNYLEHQQLQAGGQLIFRMDEQPNTMRGVSEDSKPYSMGN